MAAVKQRMRGTDRMSVDDAMAICTVHMSACQISPQFLRVLLDQIVTRTLLHEDASQ